MLLLENGPFQHAPVGTQISLSKALTRPPTATVKSEPWSQSELLGNQNDSPWGGGVGGQKTFPPTPRCWAGGYTRPSPSLDLVNFKRASTDLYPRGGEERRLHRRRSKVVDPRPLHLVAGSPLCQPGPGSRARKKGHLPHPPLPPPHALPPANDQRAPQPTHAAALPSAAGKERGGVGGNSRLRRTSGRARAGVPGGKVGRGRGELGGEGLPGSLRTRTRGKKAARSPDPSQVREPGPRGSHSSPSPHTTTSAARGAVKKNIYKVIKQKKTPRN